MRRSKSLLVVAIGTAAVLLAPVAATAAPLAKPTPGAAGIGDPYYPGYGNGGYDVANYDIHVRYEPSTKVVSGSTTINAKATQSLSSFDLDFALTTSKVTVNKQPATFRKDGLELVVTPARPLRKGAPFVVTVDYSGVPSAIDIPGASSSPWVTTADGAVGLGEPENSAWWFPANDHPLDKAYYQVSITAPKGLSALSNGNLVSKKPAAGGETTWKWVELRPQATYLAFMAVGKYDVKSGVGKSGLRYTTAIAQGNSPELVAAAKDVAQTPEIVDWLTQQWGPYPFDATGGVVPNGDIGYALEDQTRPVYDPGFWAGGRSNVSVVVHENAHQWFGDSVSVNHWRDMWLNEGFASFSEWLYAETHGGDTAQKSFDALYASHPANDKWWTFIVAEPGAHHEFDSPVYDRGSLALQAFRNKVGDKTFHLVLRGWAAAHRYGNATIEDFVAYASKVTHQNLKPFFQTWLYTGARPAPTVDNGFPPNYKPTLTRTTAPALKK